jgi:poly(hydroxyalkanoate) depolymerase family esterase
MNLDFAAAMRRAMMLTRAQDMAGAMRVIQTALAARDAPSPHGSAPDEAAGLPAVPGRTAGSIDGLTGGVIPPAGQSPSPHAHDIASGAARLRKPLGEILERLREGKARIGGLDGSPGLKSRRPVLPIPAGAQFLSRSFACAAGTRHYKLYIPASAPERPSGLVVMLHGCKQDPEDFAAGTNMNAIAEQYGVLVAYPAQPGSANASCCWNWFRPGDQLRDAGEPAIIAGLTREIGSEFGLKREQLCIAGLSAGGAMAAVMAETYPDLYAGVGIHSGLAFGSANDVVSAFAAMRGEAGIARPRPRAGSGKGPGVRTIVFHGSADAIVHPANADRIIAAAHSEGAAGQVRRERRVSPGGRSYTRTVSTGPGGDPVTEYWMIEGAGHAWSGGDPSGSYADPGGPDASREMLRFFFGPQTTPIVDGAS